MTKLIRHPNSKLTPSLLLSLLGDVPIKHLFVVAISEEGDYEVHFTSDLSWEELAAISVMTAHVAQGALDEDDEE